METKGRLLFLVWLFVSLLYSTNILADNTAVVDDIYNVNTISEDFSKKYILGPLHASGNYSTTGSGACVSLLKSGTFNDENGDGYAQVGESISYTFTVCNNGTENLFNITVADPQVTVVGGPLAFLAWTGSGNNCNATTFSANYILDNADIVACQVTNTALVSAFDGQGNFVSDLSDDPNNPTNVDINGDGDPDDPTVINLPKPPIGGGAASLVWKDLNANGVQDIGEPGVGNVIVSLFDCQGNFVSSTATDGTGAYGFSGLIPGDYQVQFDLSNLPPVCTFTYQNIGSSTIDSDANGSGMTNCFTVTNGTVEDIDAGLINYASIASSVWIDVDGDGYRDFNEPGIAGVRVEVYNSSGILVDYVFTGFNGEYAFDQLFPGDYYLKFVAPSGYDTTFPNLGNDDTRDSDVDGSNGDGTTMTVNVSSGETYSTLGAGYYECVLLGELVWYDTNKNDVFDDASENGINGIKVSVYRVVNGSPSLYDFMYTGHKPGTPSDDGYWKMCLPPGTYYVHYAIPPVGLVLANANVGGNDLLDSDVTNANGLGTTASYTLLSGQEKCDIGAGFYPQATLGDRIWYDSNQNGVQDMNEIGAANIQVNLYNNAGSLVESTSTDASGEYIFDYLGQSQYYIEVSPPIGYAITQDNSGNDATDSDIDHSNGPNTSPYYQTVSDEHIAHVDAGLISSSVLSADWLGISGERVGDINRLTWDLAQDQTAEFYIVERLNSQNEFDPIGDVIANGSPERVSYVYDDRDARSAGEYYYRVKMIAVNGAITYSDIVLITAIDRNNVIALYPNPARDQVTLTFGQVINYETASLSVFDSTGKLLISEGYKDGSTVENVNIPIGHLLPGVYQVQFTIEDRSFHEKLLIID